MDLFDKVVKFKKPEKNEHRTQQALFETEEEITPINLKETFGLFNQKMSNQQNEIKKQNERLDEQNSQNKRLANSIEALLPVIEKVRVNDDSACFNFSTDAEKKDLANWDIKAPSEAKYPLSSYQVGEKLGISSASQVGKMMKELKIKDDYLFHYEFKTGRTGKTQKYTFASVTEIYKRLEDPEKYNISNTIAIFWRKRIKNILQKKG